MFRKNSIKCNMSKQSYTNGMAEDEGYNKSKIFLNAISRHTRSKNHTIALLNAIKGSTKRLNMAGNTVSLIAMTLFPWLFLTQVYTGKSLQISHNAHLEATFGYKAYEDRVEEVERFMKEKYIAGHNKFIRQNIAKLNGINRFEVTFSIDKTHQGMKTAFERIDAAFKKIKDSKGNRLFYPYIIIGKSLYARLSSGDDVMSAYTLVNTNFVKGKIFYKCEVFESNMVKSVQKEEETKTRMDSEQIECYTIKFAEEIMAWKDGDKHYVYLSIKSYTGLLDQNINRYRTDNFENGYISYYKSYFFSFEVINYYNKDQCVDAKANFKAHSLKTLKLEFSTYKDYIKDIKTIENHSIFKRLLTNTVRTLPILLWIGKENRFQHFECAEQYRPIISKLFIELRGRFKNAMSAFIIINGILGDVDQLLESFYPELRRRLNNDVGPTHVDLDRAVEVKRRRLFNNLIDVIEDYYEPNERSSFLFYEDQLQKLREVFIDAKSIYKDKPFIANCLVEAIKKLSSSYTLLNKDYLAMINQIIKTNGCKLREDTRKKYAKGYTVLKDQDNLCVSKSSQACVGDYSYEEWIDEMHKIFDDMEKKLEIHKLLLAFIDDSEYMNEICKVKDLIEIFIRILQKESLESACKDKNDDDLSAFTAQVHIFFSAIQYSYIATVDKNKVKTDTRENDFDYSSLMPADINGKKYQYELYRQYAGLKKYLETKFGIYIATMLMDIYELNGRWCRPNFLLNEDHLAGNFRMEDKFHHKNL